MNSLYEVETWVYSRKQSEYVLWRTLHYRLFVGVIFRLMLTFLFNGTTVKVVVRKF